MPDFTALPLWGNLLVFAAAAAVVWVAGVRIARWAGAVAARTGVGDAVLGLVLLGGITSLPEVAVSVTGAVQGAGALAVNNLLGGLAFQVAILAVADLFVGRDALTSVNAEPGVLLQGALDVLLLTVVAVAIAVGDVAVPVLPFGVGAWSLALLPLYAVAVLLVGRFRGHAAWTPAERYGPGGDADADGVPDAYDPDAPALAGLAARIAAASVVILAAGAATTLAGEAIAEQTGLGSSFVGAVLLAGATSLPELSTAIESVRLRRYTMAFADVFGTNLIDVALIFVVDAIVVGPPVLSVLGPFSLVAALLGVLVTMIFVVGLIERRDRVVLRMGVDSVAVVLVYAGGIALLYRLR